MSHKEKTREKASDRAERLLIEGIIDGTYPVESDLPGERDLSKKLGIGRPALREAVQRLSRDGWLTIRQGKPTRVNDYLQNGNANVLIKLLHSDVTLVSNVVPNLLEVWALMAPAYTRTAVERGAKEVAGLLFGYRGLADRPGPYTRAQWRLHGALIEASGNPIYGLILNSFYDFFNRLAMTYYAMPGTRAEARIFWELIYGAALQEEALKAAEAMEEQMSLFQTHWRALPIGRINEMSFAEPIGDDGHHPG
jgi:GntR family negative regulator for fad regulon and positive regulator of fabA